jgi:hypothetical protein
MMQKRPTSQVLIGITIAVAAGTLLVGAVSIAATRVHRHRILNTRGTLQDVPPISSTPIDFELPDPPQITPALFAQIKLGSAQKDIAANYRLIPSDTDTDTEQRRIRLAVNEDGSGARFEFLPTVEGEWVLANKSWVDG